MNEGRHPDLDRDRSRRRTAAGAGAAGGGSNLLRSGTGFSLLSLGAVLVIVATAMTGLLEQSVAWLKGELRGGASARMEVRMINNGRQLLAALKLHAADHNGNFPESLYDLAPDPLADAELDRLLTEGSEGSESGMAWILTPDLSHAPASTEVVIVTAVPVGNGKYVAALGDGSVKTIPTDQAAEHFARIGR